jgi:hypothetical protein
MPILYMLKVSVYAGFMQIFSGTYCGLSLKLLLIFPFLNDHKIQLFVIKFPYHLKISQQNNYIQPAFLYCKNTSKYCKMFDKAIKSNQFTLFFLHTKTAR